MIYQPVSDWDIDIAIGIILNDIGYSWDELRAWARQREWRQEKDAMISASRSAVNGR